jgi:hypothetical protein
MRSTEIDATNFETIEWDDCYFKYCEFSGFSKQGGVISSDFVACSFKNLDWYWESSLKPILSDATLRIALFAAHPSRMRDLWNVD